MKYERKANKISTEINGNHFDMERKIIKIICSIHEQGNKLLKRRDEFWIAVITRLLDSGLFDSSTYKEEWITRQH